MAKYPILYPPDADDFFNMGQGPINTALTATVAEDRNGSFIFEAEVLTDDAVYPLLEHNSIIKADAGHKLKDQRFRIKRIVPTEEGKATIYAEHVSYLSQELSLLPEIKSVSLNANSALSLWKASLNESNPFTVDSDITTTGNIDWRIDRVSNPRQALGGVAGSLLDIYGGEYRFDNYHISLLKKRGTTANTVLAYGRNITTFEQEKNITSTYTSVYPYAVYTNDAEQEIVVTLDQKTVHCSNVGAFPNPVVKSVDFSGEFEHDEIPTQAELKTLAEKYVRDNEFGIPSVSIKVSFLDLSKTADYADYQALEEVNLCDDVRVIFPKLGVDTVAKVTRTVWNVLAESYDEIEIGEKRASLSTIISDQGHAIKEVEKNTGYAVISADGKNTIFYGLFGPDGLGEPKATKVGDMWFRPNGQMRDLLIWNGTIWEEILSSSMFKALENEINTAIKEAEQAKEDAKQAFEDAVAETERQVAKQEAAFDEKMSTAKEEFQSGLSEVNAKSDKAVKDAKGAADKADQSSKIAEAAEQIATGLISGVEKAQSDAKEALDEYKNLSFENRQFLLVTANEMKFKGNNTASQTGLRVDFSLGSLADCGFKPNDKVTLKCTVKVSGSGFSGQLLPQFYGGSWMSFNGFTKDISRAETFDIEQTVTLYDTTMAATGIRIRLDNVPATVTVEVLQKTLKFEKGTRATDWSYAPEDVQISLTTIGNEVAQKASQQAFDSLNGKVLTVETIATQNKNQIAFKANKTDVDTISGKVSSVESTLSTQAGTIAALSTKTDGHSAQIGSLESSYSGMSSTIVSVQKDLAEKATIVQFSALTQTLSALQGTVSGKADIGQVTLLENQFTALIGGQTRNLLKNSDFRNGTANWYGTGIDSIPIHMASQTEKIGTGFDIKNYIRVTKASLAGGNAYPGQSLSDPNSYRGKKLRFALSYRTVDGFANGSPIQATVRYTVDGSTYYVRFNDRSDGYLEKSARWSRVDCLLDLTGVSATSEITDIRIYLGFIESRFLTDAERVFVSAFTVTEDGNLYDWGYDYVRSQSYSQITQLQELIDLRVTKDGVLTAISLSPETVRILGKRIQLDGDVTMTAAWMTKLYADSAFVTRFEAKSIDAVSANITSIITGHLQANVITANHLKIDSSLINNLFATTALVDVLTSKVAFISAIKAIEISATKITTGELNGLNVNIVNLNAGNITAGYLNVNRIKAKSITADLLAANAIQVGFNSLGNTLELSSTALSFYSAGILSAKLNDYGMEFWYGTRKVGWMGENNKVGSTTVRGIVMDLEYTGDYISWGFRKSASATQYTTMLLMDPKGTFTGEAGIHSDLDIIISSSKSLKTDHLRSVSYTGEVQFGLKKKGDYSFLGSEAGTAGIAINGGKLRFYEDGYYYDFENLKKLTWFGGRTVVIPTAIDSDGTVRSWQTITF